MADQRSGTHDQAQVMLAVVRTSVRDVDVQIIGSRVPSICSETEIPIYTLQYYRTQQHANE